MNIQRQAIVRHGLCCSKNLNPDQISKMILQNYVAIILLVVMRMIGELRVSFFREHVIVVRCLKE